MELKIKKSECLHLNLSCYNSNYYGLPFEINGCDVLHENYDGADNFNGNTIGIINEDGNYVIRYYLHQDDDSNDVEFFYFNSKTINTVNEWT